MSSPDPVPATVSPLDQAYLLMIRENVRAFLGRVASAYVRRPGLLLDIAPQVHEGARPYFPEFIQIETLDIDPAAGATYTADLCSTNSSIPAGRFDFAVCTEVLEHVLNPFLAVSELKRVLAPGGLVFVSTPFNFRIHGPLPDCWRFTEHGLRALFCGWEVIKLAALETSDRFLMPIHYTLVARSPGPPPSSGQAPIPRDSA